MSTVIAIDNNNDMYLDSSNNIALLTGQDAVKQACLTAAQTQLGECFLEIGRGLPNFQLIWVGSPNYSAWQSYLVSTFLAVDGVVAVTSVGLNHQGNVLAYQATIETVYGAMFLSGVLKNG